MHRKGSELLPLLVVVALLVQFSELLDAGGLGENLYDLGDLGLKLLHLLLLLLGDYAPVLQLVLEDLILNFVLRVYLKGSSASEEVDQESESLGVPVEEDRVIVLLYGILAREEVVKMSPGNRP